jgi:hypothetical protein
VFKFPVCLVASLVFAYSAVCCPSGVRCKRHLVPRQGCYVGWEPGGSWRRSASWLHHRFVVLLRTGNLHGRATWPFRYSDVDGQ